MGGYVKSAFFFFNVRGSNHGQLLGCWTLTDTYSTVSVKRYCCRSHTLYLNVFYPSALYVRQFTTNKSASHRTLQQHARDIVVRWVTASSKVLVLSGNSQVEAQATWCGIQKELTVFTVGQNPSGHDSCSSLWLCFQSGGIVSWQQYFFFVGSDSWCISISLWFR